MKRKVKKRVCMIVVVFSFLIFVFLLKWVLIDVIFDSHFEAKDDTSTSANFVTPDDYEFLDLPNTEVFQNLKSFLWKDQRMVEILENYKQYPIELLEMLSRNIEMLDFVVDFPKSKGTVSSSRIGSFQKDEIPLFLQWDQRWGYARYGDDYLAISGCAPVALSMVIVGLTGDTSITPYVVSKYAMEQDYYVYGVGTSWELMTQGSKHFGVIGTAISLSKNGVYRYLKNGNPIICSMRPGDFTTTGHFIVLVGIENGLIRINDPNSKKRSSQLWDYDTLSSQIKNLWVFEKK